MNGPNTRWGLARTWLGRQRLFLLIAVTYGYFFQGGDPNQASRYYLTQNLVERVAPDITPEHPLTIDKGELGGKFYSDKAPGVSFMAVVPFAVLRAAERVVGLDPRDRAVERARLHAIVFFVSGLAGVLAAYFLRRVLLLLGTPPRAASLLTVGYALGTLAFPYSTVLFGHQTAAAILVATFAMSLEASKRPARSTRVCLALGALWALAIAVEYPTALIVAVLGVYLLSLERHPRDAARTLGWTIVGALPVVAVHAAYTTWAFGTPFVLPTKYVCEPIFRAHTVGALFGIGLPRLDVLREVLVGRYRGLFFLCPFLALAIAGVGEWIRRDERVRELVVCVAIVGLSLAMTAGYYAWDGGFSTGPRHLVPALPFFVVPIAWWARRGGWAAKSVALLVVPSVAIMGACTAVLVHAPEGNPATSNSLYRIILPALGRGEVALNPLDIFHAAWCSDSAYNLGTLFGLGAWSSLLLLAAVWLAVYARDVWPPRAPA